MDHDENTFFENIKSLPPSKFKIVNSKLSKIYEYWNLENDQETNLKSTNKVSYKLNSLFNNSIKEHLVSDIEIGTCLSGGNDSSSISSITSSHLKYKLKTFTYEFEDQIKNTDNEIFRAKQFCKKKKL